MIESLNSKKFADAVKILTSTSMGTENMGPFLYSLIKFVRPHRVLEVGGGLTTIYILAALKEIFDLEKKENSGNSSDYNPDYRNKEYYNLKHPKYCLHSFDNFQHPKTSANHVEKIAEDLGYSSLLKFWNDDYKKLPNLLPKEEQDFDLIWCDLGSLLDYIYQKNMLFPLLSNRTGSYIIFHSTLTNVHGLAFISKLKLDIIQGRLPDFEIISFLEPHKTAQNSCTIIRKASGLSNNIYSERP
tara:strand:+ start:56 stop:784 length:729 start_codon:yes stop_codon:yes gene_type:complete